MQKQSVIADKSATIIAGILALFGLYFASLHNFLLFHSLAELFSIVVACGIFIVAWNSRRFLDNNYLLFLGIAYLFVGGLDLIHTLGYTGMGVFQGYGTNLPAQLWIGTRYVESLSLFIAPLLLGRKLKPNLVFITLTLVISLLLGSIFYWDVFPVCFVEGVGLTSFKKISEYIISLILLGSIFLLFQKHEEFERYVFKLLVASIIVTIASELAFTFYIHAYGFSNLIGHYLKIISFYLIYKALIETGLTRPYERKQAEQALQREKLLSDSIIDNMPAGIAFLDNDFVLRKCNPAYVELIRIYTPYSPEQAIGMSYFEYVPGSRSQVEEWFQKVRDSGQEETRYGFKLVIDRDGQEEATYWDTSIAPVLEPSGNVQGILILTQDVTERHRAEELVRDSEYYYRLLIHSMHEDILVIAPDYRIIDVNNTFLVTLKTKREDVVGHHCFEVSHGYNEPCDIRGEDCPLKEVFETGEPQNCSHIHQTVDGSKIWVDILYSPLKDKKGKVTHVISAVRDITALIKAEEELKKSEKKYRLLVENANDAIFITQDEVVKFPNPKTEELTGYSAEELARIPFVNLIHPDEREMVFDRHKRRLKGEELPSTYSFRIINKTGEELWVQLSTVLINWEGRPATLNFIRDITQQRKLEAQLQQAQKMESIGTLAGGIAHDFNNILSPIMIHSQMVMMELPSGSPLKQNMKQIYKAGERARDLVKQILTFARRQEKERISLKVSRILKEAIKLLRSTIPTTIDIQYHINSEQDTVLSDPAQMNQIIMNLCINAAHAMEENGGTLEVILTNENLDSESANEFPDLDPGRYVKLSVRDTGHGIDPQIMDKIFEPYFTTKEVGKGTGMGLALVHGIVKSYGGAVTVQSEVGKGTSLHVYLPLVEGDTGILETAKDSVQLPTGTERILFVDDEKVAVDAIQPMLESLGYKVTTRTSSIEALEAFRNNPQGFDLVITDMTMPNMTGKDLAKELMAIRPNIPIILCTGFSEQIDEKKAMQMGIRAYVMKPIVMSEIANTIRQVLDEN